MPRRFGGKTQVLSKWEKPPRVVSVVFASPRLPQIFPQFSTSLHFLPQIPRMPKISTVRLIFDNPRPMYNQMVSDPSGIAPSDAYWDTRITRYRGWTLCPCKCPCFSCTSWDYSLSTMSSMLSYRSELHLYGNVLGWRRVPLDSPSAAPLTVDI